MTIGQEIRRRREEKGWSQAKLGVLSGTGPSGVSQIETGRRNPSAATLQRIAEALGVGVRDLFPLGQAPLPDFDGERRESGLPEAADHDHYRWVRSKSTVELQRIALEEAQYAKAPTVEEAFEEYKVDKKAANEKARRRTLAYVKINAINAELYERGVRSPVELAVKQFDAAMSPPNGASRESGETQEGQRAG